MSQPILELAIRSDRIGAPNPLGTMLNLVAERNRLDQKTISFAGGYPVRSILTGPVARDVDELFHTILTNTQQAGLGLDYSGSGGYPPLQEYMANHIGQAAGISIKPENVLPTNGLQEGINLAAFIVCDPGDVILAEGDTYGGALGAFLLQDGVEVWGVQTDEKGMIPDAIRDAVTIARREGKRVKMIYAQTTGNPNTSEIITEDRGLELVALAESEGFGIFQDNAYDNLIYDGTKPTPPLLKYNQGLVIYGWTDSKMLAPGLRSGGIIAPEHALPALRGAKLGSNLANSAIIQMAVTEYKVKGKMHKNLPFIRAAYQQRRDTMATALSQQDILEWEYPRAGMFAKARNKYGMPTGDAVLKELLQRFSVVFLPESGFRPKRYIGDSSKRKSEWMRLNFTGGNEEDIPPGIHDLAEGLEDIAVRKGFA